MAGCAFCDRLARAAGERSTMRLRPLLTMPRCFQSLSSRLTVCSVVPVISATSCRVIGKLMPMPSFLDAQVRILQPLSHGLQRNRAQLRMAAHEALPSRRRPRQAHAFLHGQYAGGVTGLPHRASQAKHIARIDISHDNLIAFRCNLGDLEATVQQHEEMGAFGALPVSGFAGFKAAGNGVVKRGV